MREYTVVCDDGVSRITDTFHSIVSASMAAEADPCGMRHLVVRATDGTVVRHVPRRIR